MAIQTLLPNTSPELAGPINIDLGKGETKRFEFSVNETSLPRGGSIFPRCRSVRDIRIFTFRDISEITRSKEVRQTTAVEAWAAAAAEAEFLHNMGHELRTPLNSVIGFSEILKDELFGPIGNEQYRQYLLVIHGCGIHLSQVINEILYVSKIEAGVCDLDEESIDIGALIADAVDVSKSWEFARELELSHEALVNGLALTGDLRLRRHALLDILSNTMKLSPQGGRVDLAVQLSHDDYLSFIVQDCGMGSTPNI